ncbi:MAG TPA: ribosome recycling factor [Flavobacteriales bacterium]|nr:ribosome recycling factor [Flavobacteriales bacterium]
MNENVKLIIDETRSNMGEAVEHLANELLKIRAGRANPIMLDGIMVDYYGAMTPLAQVSNISTPDARSLRVQPWEKKMLEPISNAIIAANLGLNPQNNGEVVMINVPPLTEERRKDLVKKAKSVCEDAKVVVRNHRKEANDMIKALAKEGLPEDEGKQAEEKVQELTNQHIAKIDEQLAAKEKDILTV